MYFLLGRSSEEERPFSAENFSRPGEELYEKMKAIPSLTGFSEFSREAGDP
jgi:hypothetical protein